MKKSAISNPDASKSSKVTEDYWLYALREKPGYPHSAARDGKWLLFVRRDSIDEVWEKIKRATEEGRLGGQSKVSTSMPSPFGKPDLHVICVYTYDYEDAEDVRRVREELRKLGFPAKISYKADEDTYSRKYRVTGHTRIAKYYE